MAIIAEHTVAAAIWQISPKVYLPYFFPNGMLTKTVAVWIADTFN